MKYREKDLTFDLNEEEKTAIVEKCANHIKPTKYEIPATVSHNGIDYAVTGIAGYAFKKHTEMTAITIPNGVKYIGEWAFWNCGMLESIVIPDSVTMIEAGAFEACHNLKNVELTDNIEIIDDWAFRSCTSLEHINVSPTTEIGENVFYQTPLEHIVEEADLKFIVNDVTHHASVYITDGAASGFSGKKAIPEKIHYNNTDYTVARIGDNAFCNCSKLEQINIPDSITEIAWSAFANCNALKSIAIPKSVTEIKPFAFGNCLNLVSVTLPDSVTSLEKNVFKGCMHLTEIRIPGTDKAFPLWVSLMESEYADLVQIV